MKKIFHKFKIWRAELLLKIISRTEKQKKRNKKTINKLKKYIRNIKINKK